MFLRENFPKIDGSTSLIPLDAGVRAAIFGTSLRMSGKVSSTRPPTAPL